MKRIVYFLIPFLMTSCINVDDVHEESVSLPITYEVGGVETKATLVKTENLAEQFPIMEVKAVRNNEVQFTEYMNLKKSPIYDPSTIRYWDGSEYTFFSFPTTSNFKEIKTISPTYTNDSMSFNFTVGQDSKSTYDLVVACTKKSSGTVSLDYKHVFAGIEVYYKELKYGHKITSIKVKNVNLTGRCTASTSSVAWSNLSNKGDIVDSDVVYATRNNTELNKDGSKFMVIPGQSAQIEVVIDGKDVKSTVVSNLVAGEMYKYTITDELELTKKEGSYCGATIEGDVLKVEAYVTGEYTTTTTTSSKPMDFILVLDYSGSMNDSYSVHSGEASTYQRVSASGTTSQKVNKRIYALESAVYQFLDKVKADEAASGVTHRVSMIQFQNPKWPRVNTTLNSERKLYIKEGDSRYLYPYSPGTTSSDNANYTTTSVIAQFADVNDASILTMKKAMSAVTWAGCTAADYGMHLASLQVGKCRTKDSKGKDVGKCIIVFSDGKPTHAYGAILSDCVIPGYYSSGTYLSDDQVIAGAIKYAQVCKDKGAEIFTIFTGDSKQKNNTFLEGVATDKNHFQDASSSSLSDAFNKIVTETTAGTPDIDVHTDAFLQVHFSNAVNVSSATYVGGYTLTQSSYNESTKAITFGTNHGGLSGINVNIDTANSTVKVSGFDYGKYFCGKGANGKGMKLVLEFKLDKNTDLTGTGSNKVLVYPSGLYKDKDTPLYLVDSPDITL